VAATLLGTPNDRSSYPRPDPERLEMKTVIAICGPRTAGKSELRKQIELHIPDAWHFPFAYFLKRMLAQFMREQSVMENEIQAALYGDQKEKPQPCFNGQSALHAMQTIGTDWRNMISPTLWSDAWDRKVSKTDFDGVIIVDDLRFKHEEMMLRKYNTTIVRIYRPGVLTDNTHISEREHVNIQEDISIYNFNTPEYLYACFLDRYTIHLVKKEMP
jgi:hypothetical protein